MKLFKITSTAIAIVAIILLSSDVANAGLYDPSYRGADNSVHAIFGASLIFDSQDSSISVDWYDVLFETGPSIYDLDSSLPGVFINGDDAVIGLPNFIDPLPLKRMRIQMAFGTPIPGDEVPIIDILAYDPLPTDWTIVGSSGAGVSNVHYIDSEIWPNPNSEQITLFGGAVYGIQNTPEGITVSGLMTLEIDTVSVPEPATMSLLAMGGLTMLRRRRIA